MADGKGPSGWERGLRAGVFCPVCLHRPWLRPAARPADTAAARRDGDGHGADGLMGAKLQSPMCSLRGPCVLPAWSLCAPCEVPMCSLRGPHVLPARSPCVPCVVPARSPRSRAAAGCPCRGSSALPVHRCHARCWQDPGSKAAPSAQELGFPPGDPPTFSSRWPGRDRARRGGGGSSCRRLGGSAGLGRALRVRAAPRHRSYTDRYTLAPPHQRPR